MSMCCPSSQKQLGHCCTLARCVLERTKGRKEKWSSDWVAIDRPFVPSGTILPCLPIFPLFPLSLFLSLFLSLDLFLMLLNILPPVPWLGVQVALPELHYIKASMLHSWQPALHCPDVITTLRPWNRSILALWQLGNPPLSRSVFASWKIKLVCSFGCQNKACNTLVV